MLKDIIVPDIGSYSNVDIIEVLVKTGDKIEKETSLITLETEKATMEIPSPYEGIVKEIKVKAGDKISKGDLILSMEIKEDGLEKEQQKEEASREIDESKKEKKKEKEEPKETSKEEESKKTKNEVEQPESKVKSEEKLRKESETEKEKPSKSETSEIPHAGPGVRRYARELGVELENLTGTGRKGRIIHTDVQNYVKDALKRVKEGGAKEGSPSIGLQKLAAWPEPNYKEFGSIEIKPVQRIKKLSGSFLHRNWVMVPHVTQFDEADITDLEKFRKESQNLMTDNIKLTPLVFIMKAVVRSLEEFPNFNASLNAEATEIIFKKYFHIGVAVDTPNGLVVPVIRDVDKKGLFLLAKELAEISEKARRGQLSAKEMQGSSFSISSLGGIGGTAFTPIINVPDVAILGVSKSQMKPVYKNDQFIPRLILPLSLSYDHRIIDGAEAVRFTTFLTKQLSDIRRLLL